MGFEIFWPGTATKRKYIIFINHSITVNQSFKKKMKKSSREAESIRTRWREKL